MPENEDIEYRKAVAKYSASFMSNAKWLTLFRSIIQSGASVERAEWRFIDSTHSIWESFPTERDLTPTRFADGRFQPIEYRWLESVYIPSRFKPIAGVGYEREQDTAAIVSVLEKVGKFPVEQSSGGITIRAYLRQNDA